MNHLDTIHCPDGEYTRDRPAFRSGDGSYALAQLGEDEVLVSPGVIYRRIGKIDDAPPT